MSRPEPAAEIEVTLSKSEIAAALGALGAGKKKTLTDEQRAAQRARLAKVRAKRWANRPAKPTPPSPDHTKAAALAAAMNKLRWPSKRKPAGQA